MKRLISVLFLFLAIGIIAVPVFTVKADDDYDRIEALLEIERQNYANYIQAKGYVDDLAAEGERVVYGVENNYMPEEVYECLFNCLNEEGVLDWLPYAVCQAFQESSFDTEIYADHDEGLDCGLFQYFTRYWEDKCNAIGISGADVFDYEVQCKVYAHGIRERRDLGLSTDEIIRLHFNSGKAELDSNYVRDVKSHYKSLTTK